MKQTCRHIVSLHLQGSSLQLWLTTYTTILKPYLSNVWFSQQYSQYWQAEKVNILSYPHLQKFTESDLSL